MAMKPHNSLRLGTQGPEAEKEIYDSLIMMYPKQREIITHHYNDESGEPFSEWRQKIRNIDEWTLNGPITVNPDEFYMYENDMRSRQKKFDNYLSGEAKKYFRYSDSNPTEMDFTKIPAITLEKTEEGYLVIDGKHRAFLAKMMNKSLEACIWINETNNSPYVNKIKKLFNWHNLKKN